MTGDIDWDAYAAEHAFVFEHGDGLLHLLDANPGERILDLGSGNGHLTCDIDEAGATAVGLDGTADLVGQARGVYPTIEFRHDDPRSFEVEEPFDAVFSNAALHWLSVGDQDAVLESVAEAVVPGGRFVAELGGVGSLATVVDAVLAELDVQGYDGEVPWYFPSVGEYATRLETAGFEVRYATLLDSPATLDGEDGLREWLESVGKPLLDGVSDAERGTVVAGIEERLRPALFDGEDWTLDHRRLRVVAHAE